MVSSNGMGKAGNIGLCLHISGALYKTKQSSARIYGRQKVILTRYNLKFALSTPKVYIKYTSVIETHTKTWLEVSNV